MAHYTSRVLRTFTEKQNASKFFSTVNAKKGNTKEGRAASDKFGGISMIVPVSPELCRLIGVSETSRVEAIRKLWAYVKLNDLQNPADRREILCDEKLRAVFGKDKVGILEIGKLVAPHFKKKE